MRRFDFAKKNLKGKRILDVGNLDGGGKIHGMLMAALPNTELHGFDILDQSTIGLSFPFQKIGSFENMSGYEDDYFDSIYMGEVLEHTWTPKLVIEQCHRILANGGVLVADTPNVYSLSRMLRYMVTGKDVILGNPDHKLFFSMAMIENLLENSGFKVRVLTSENYFTLKGRKIPLPRIGSLRSMGECLLFVAEKR